MEQRRAVCFVRVVCCCRCLTWLVFRLAWREQLLLLAAGSGRLPQAAAATNPCRHMISGKLWGRSEGAEPRSTFRSQLGASKAALCSGSVVGSRACSETTSHQGSKERHCTITRKVIISQNRLWGLLLLMILYLAKSFSAFFCSLFFSSLL
jgi:hypothetical protein